jgi:hypothetical protein
LQPFRDNPHHFNYRRNTLKKTTRALALFAVAAAALPAHAIDMNANMEFDNLIENQKRGISQGGRVEFNVSGKGGPGYFVAGRASFLAKKDGNAGIDDMWVQGGNATADVKLGRFEAADLFLLPRDAYTPASLRTAPMCCAAASATRTRPRRTGPSTAACSTQPAH